MQFPEGFLWGTATAAHQVEGNNINSDFWVLEHLPVTIFAEPSGDAVDHYHRYTDDIQLLADLGFNSYRFSVEWARIEPEPGFFSNAELNHYRRMLQTCHDAGLKPVITMHHFTSPRWLVTQGGWTSDETPGKFAAYCAKTMETLGDLVDTVCTINEMNIPAMIAQWISGGADQRQRDFTAQALKAFGVEAENYAPFLMAATEKATEIILQAHRESVVAMKAIKSETQIGMTLALADMQALPGGEAHRDAARARIQDVFLEAARGDDFIGVQTYTRDRFGPEGSLPAEEGAELTQMGYEFYPQALGATIRYASKVSGVPVMVTESGVGTEDDTRRLAYYQIALAEVAKALKDGIDVRGYYAWSAFDNFEWMLGYRPTFGIIAVDRATQIRTVKPSAKWLGKVAQANAIPELTA